MGPTLSPGTSPSERSALVIGLAAAVLAISTAAPVIRLAAPLEAEAIACLRVSVTALCLWALTFRASAAAFVGLARAPREAALTLVAGLCLGTKHWNLAFVP